MEPVSRSTNGTHTPAPTPALDGPDDPPAPPAGQDPPAEPAAPDAPAGPAPPRRPLAGHGPPLGHRPPAALTPSPASPPAGPPAALGAPPRSLKTSSTWWGGPMRAGRPLDRLSGLAQALVGDAVLRHVAGRRVLDLGHGSPEIAQWVRTTAASLETVDVRLAATDEGEIRLPHASDRYDVVYSVRTLAHLGHDEASSDLAVRSLLAEAARVVVPGGVLLVEINNPRSLRGLAYGIRRPITIVAPGSVVVADQRNVTRYDTLSRLIRLAPRTLELAHVYGIRVLVPISRALKIPLIGRLLAAGEWWARDSFLRGFGAHLLVALRKHDEPVKRPIPSGRPGADPSKKSG
jgi:SAM-dependent methyltransferase